MSSSVSFTVLLCEDDAHARLVKAYLRECGLSIEGARGRTLVASREVPGGNVGWVLQRFPEELYACRQRQKKAKTLLIVVLDADDSTVEQRRQQLNARLRAAGFDELQQEDPVAILIPRRNGETWVCSLLGMEVNEEEECKGAVELSKANVRDAAKTLFAWSREHATPGETCVESLELSLEQWRKIG